MNSSQQQVKAAKAREKAILAYYEKHDPRSYQLALTHRSEMNRMMGHLLEAGFDIQGMSPEVMKHIVDNQLA